MAELIAAMTTLLGVGFGVAHAQPTPEGAEFQVNVVTTGSQFNPEVCIDGSRNFVVVWRDSNRPEISAFAVTGQRFDASGSPAGGEFIVNDGTTFRAIGG